MNVKNIQLKNIKQLDKVYNRLMNNTSMWRNKYIKMETSLLPPEIVITDSRSNSIVKYFVK